jgi:hypothetical protein
VCGVVAVDGGSKHNSTQPTSKSLLNTSKNSHVKPQKRVMIIRISLLVPLYMEQLPLVTQLMFIIRKQVSIAFGTVADLNAVAVGTAEGGGGGGGGAFGVGCGKVGEKKCGGE